MLASVGGWAVHLGNVGKELIHIIENEHYPLSQRIRVLRSIREPTSALDVTTEARKVPDCEKRTATARPPTPQERSPARAPRSDRPRRSNNAPQVSEFPAILGSEYLTLCF